MQGRSRETIGISSRRSTSLSERPILSGLYYRSGLSSGFRSNPLPSDDDAGRGTDDGEATSTSIGAAIVKAVSPLNRRGRATIISPVIETHAAVMPWKCAGATILMADSLSL